MKTQFLKSNTTLIDNTDLSPGVYLFSIVEGNKKVFNEKLVIIR